MRINRGVVDVCSFSPQKEVYMIAAGVIGGVFVICTVVMFLGVKERDGEAHFQGQ